jgi:hypothetical protein
LFVFSLRYYLIEFAKLQGRTPNHTPPKRQVTFKINTHLAIRNIPRILNIHHHSKALQRFHNLLAQTHRASTSLPSAEMKFALRAVFHQAHIFDILHIRTTHGLADGLKAL